MKSLQLMAAMILVAIVLIVSSCSKNEALAPIPAIDNTKVGNHSSVQMTDSSAVVLFDKVNSGQNLRAMAPVSSMNIISTIPGVNTLTPLSIVGYSNSCGTFNPGLFQTKILSVSGMKMKMRTQLKTGLQFGQSGILQIREQSTCGTMLNQIAISAGLFYVDLDVTVNTVGKTLLYPVVTLGPTQTKYYCSPVEVYSEESLPVSDLSNGQKKLPFGSIYGYVNSVAVYAGRSDFGSGGDAIYPGYPSVAGRVKNYTGLKWQCVEFVRRFYWINYGKFIGNNSNAKDFYSNAPNWGMRAYPNGGTVGPRVGDIIVFGPSATNPNGHVAIPVKVTSKYILLVQQNVYGDVHINYYLVRNGNTLSSAFGSNVIGWIR